MNQLKHQGVKMNLVPVKYIKYFPSALHYGYILFSDTLVNIGPNLFCPSAVLGPLHPR